MKIPYADTNGRLTAEVHLNNQANVFLVDDHNYRKMNSGQSFNYYGGFYKRTPVSISINKPGRWYLIVEGSDYKYRFYWRIFFKFIGSSSM